MILSNVLLQILQVVCVLVLAPLLQGFILKAEERVQRSRGPSFLQPYRDLWKLFHKQSVVPESVSWIYLIAPIVAFTAMLRMQEIRNSIALILAGIAEMPEGEVDREVASAPGTEGLGWCEGTRGSLYYCVHFDQKGRFARVKVKSPSFSNWRVFPFTVHDTNMMDYAINEASFGLTMAGCDR